MELEHVGIAVRNARTAIELIEVLLGERPYKSETVEQDAVRTHFIRTGGAKLELLEALGESSPVARHIEKRGPGLHHLAFEVADLEETQRRLTSAGFTVLGEPRPGADGKHIFFVHPRDTGGVLFEFCRQSRAIEPGQSAGPPACIIGDLPLDVDVLLRRLEQSARVLKGDAEDDAHLIVASGNLALPARMRSLSVVVDRTTDSPPPGVPVLIAARPAFAGAAVKLYEAWPDSDLVVGHDDLLAAGIEKHIRSVEGV